MLQSKNIKKLSILKFVITTLFVISEVILGILVQTTSGTLNTTSSFLVVIIAFMFSIYILIEYIISNGILSNNIENNTFKLLVLLSSGLLFTIFADLFLVVLNPMKQVLAMIFFSVTQICYFMIIYLNQEKKNRIIHLIIRLSVIVIALLSTILVLKKNTDALSLISLFYYANLIVNIAFSFRVKKINLLLSIGLILFACCDLQIGLNIMASSYLPLKEGTILYFLAHPGFNLAWVFYVPSQILISLSGLTINK